MNQSVVGSVFQSSSFSPGINDDVILGYSSQQMPNEMVKFTLSSKF